MTVLGSLTRSLNNPSVPITSASLAEWLGGDKTKAGTLVSEQRVLGLPAYRRGITIKASVLAMLPVKIYEVDTRRRMRVRTVLSDPSPRHTPFLWRQTMFINAQSWGNAYARKVRNGADQVVEAWPIHPSQVRVEAVDPTEADPAGKLFLVRDKRGVEHRWTRWEVFHLPWFAPDGVVGLSALQGFRESLGVAIAAEDAAGSMFANGSRLSGLLKLKDEDPDGSRSKRMKSRWRELYNGADNAGEIAVVDNGAEFQPISMPAKDAELLGSRQWSVTEIARIVGLPPHMIGDVSGSTSWGTGIEQQFIGWTQVDVGPWAKNTEEIYTAELLPGGWNSGPWFAEHDLEGLLRGDSVAQTAFFASAIQWGWMNRNEVRARKNLEPMDGLDEFLTPSNMTLISIDGTPVPLAQSGGGGDAG